MELESLRRKLEEDRNFHKSKTKTMQQEVDGYIRENQRLVQEKEALNARLSSLRQLNRRQEKKIEQGNFTMKQSQRLLESERRAE